MKPTLTLNDLEAADRGELLRLWEAHFKIAAPRSIGEVMLRRVLGFEVQVKDQSGLDRATKGALKSTIDRLPLPSEGPTILQRSELSRILPVRPRTRFVPGTRLMREWNGKTHVVETITGGFAYQGKTYTSLSQIAKVITGAHWSGPRFFGLSSGTKTRAGSKS